MRKELKKLLDEINRIHAEYKGKEMPANIGEDLDSKAAEAKSLQDKIDAEDARNDSIKALNDRARRVVGGTDLPGDEQPEGKAAGRAEQIVGLISPGKLVSASPALVEFLAKNKPQQGFTLGNIPSPFRRKYRGMVPLSAKMMAELKAVPTIGDDVIEPMRLDDIARDEEQARLTIRDIVGSGTTTKNAVRYLRQTYTRAAAAVAQGALKPEATLELESLLAEVRKVAVWLPIDDEQLDDMPELGRIIDDELLYDLNKLIEELMMWGSGTGEEFNGICVDPDIPTARVVGGDTLIDTARRMITDVRIARYEPNGLVVHPLDFEEIVLEKGSDSRYVWVVVTEGDQSRIWGVPVIETVAAENFAGSLVEERRMVVGDWKRGATLWDRQQANVQVGWINDQFTKNKRTILAEARAAFAVRRPLAFVTHETVAEDVS